MATLAEIYDWFMSGKKPTQAQFWASWGSFWNKGESIPQSSISGLPGVLNAKAEKAQFDAHKTDTAAHAALFDGKEDKSQKGEAGGYVPLDEFVKIANEYLTIVNDLVTGGATSLASAETVKTLKTQIDGINTILTSNDVNLDTVQEVVDAIKTVETSLSTILVNDLTTGGTTKALTAEMGKTLKGLIDGLVVPTATDTVRGIVKTDVPVVDPVVYIKDTVDNLLKAKVNAILEIKPITGIAYTLIAYDTENLVQLAYDGTLPMTVTIPNDATLNLPIGSIFYTVGSNTGAVTIAGGSGVTFQTAVGLTAGQNETRKYVKKAANKWGIEGGSVPIVPTTTIIPQTYYVDTINGNNATAQVGNINKPYKTIDAVLPFVVGVGTEVPIVELITSGTYPINNQMASSTSVSFRSQKKVVITFESNPNANLWVYTIGGGNLEFLIPNGNIVFSNTVAQGFNSTATLKIVCNEFYSNYGASAIFFNCGDVSFFAKKITTKRTVISVIGQSIVDFECKNTIVNSANVEVVSNLASSASIVKYSGNISGTGNIVLASIAGNIYVNDIITTGNTLITAGNPDSIVHFNNSYISGTTIVLSVWSIGKLTLTGKIREDSAPMSNVYTFNGVLILKDFTHDFKANTIGLVESSLILQNVNLKCNTVPFGTPSAVTKTVEFYGTNSIYSATPTVVFSGATATPINKYGILRTNIPSLGSAVVLTDKTPTTF